MANKVLNLLSKNKIKYTLIKHPPVYTSEEADKYVEGLDVIKVKNLFLKDKHNYFLVMLPDDKRLNLKLLATKLQAKRLHFAHEEDLERKLGIESGAVSPFNLINNREHDVVLVIDSLIANANRDMVCHPNDNTKSLILSVKDLLAVVDKLDNEVKIINLSEVGENDG